MIPRDSATERKGIIWILADAPRDADFLRSVVGDGAHVVSAAGELLAEYERGDCLVFGCRRGCRPQNVELLLEIVQQLPWLPVILVTDREAEVVSLLSRVRLSALVRFEDVPTHLRGGIEGARSPSLLARVAETVRRSMLPPALRAALVHCLRQADSIPVGTVKELADAVRRSRTTLFQEFRLARRGTTTLAGFLRALVILRAHELRASGLNWKTVSTDLGFRRGSLNRKAKAWPGCTLSALERIPRAQLLDAFLSEHIAPLLDEDRPGATDPRLPEGRTAV